MEELLEDQEKDIRFLISHEWWNDWCDYVQYQIDSNLVANKKSKFPPNQIKNQRLVKYNVHL